jgi:hypothetical protein
VKRLIETIRDDKKLHYLYGYTAEERNKIIRTVKREFKSDVRVISSDINWKNITKYEERIKILIYSDKLINKYRLGEDFKNLVNDGSIYLLFSKNKIDDFVLKQDWFKFLKTLEPGAKYKYKPKKRPKRIAVGVTAQEKAKINYRKTASFISHLILIGLIFLYIAVKGLKAKSVEGFDLLLLSCTTLDVVNLFFGFYVYRLFREKMEPRIYDRLNKSKKMLSIISKFFKALNNAAKALLGKIKNGELDDE